MGKCSVCGNKIQYNQYEKIDGIIYCLSCCHKKTRQILDEGKIALDKKLTKELGEPMNMTIIDEAKNVDFTVFADELAKIPGVVVSGEVSDKDINNKIAEETELEKKVCKYCGAKTSSEWLKMLNGEWCCKRRACRNKANKQYNKTIVTFQKHYPYEAED